MKLPFSEKTNLWIHRRYREVLWRNHGLHALYLAVRGRKVDTANADIAVEGFGRSGNTFVVNALQVTQDRPLRFISHFHYPIAVARSVAAGIPVCVVLRNPYDSIASYCQYGIWGPQRYIDDFLAYHRYVRPWLGRICVVEFEEFTRDFNTLIRAMNRVHGPILREAEEVETLSERVFRRIEEIQPGGEIDELRVHRPSDLRKRRKPEILEDIRSNHADGMEKVMQLHAEYQARARELQAN